MLPAINGGRIDRKGVVKHCTGHVGPCFAGITARAAVIIATRSGSAEASIMYAGRVGESLTTRPTGQTD